MYRQVYDSIQLGVHFVITLRMVLVASSSVVFNFFHAWLSHLFSHLKKEVVTHPLSLFASPILRAHALFVSSV